MTYLAFKKTPTIALTNADLSYYDSGFPFSSYYYYTLTKLNVKIDLSGITSPVTSLRLIIADIDYVNVGDILEVVRNGGSTTSFSVYLTGELSPSFSNNTVGNIKVRYFLTSKTPSLDFSPAVSFSATDSFLNRYPSTADLLNTGTHSFNSLYSYGDVTLADSLDLTLGEWCNLKINKNGNIVLNANHVYGETPLSTYITSKREGAGVYDSVLAWEENAMTWTVKNGENTAQSIQGSYKLTDSTSYYYYNANGTKQFPFESPARVTHTQVEHTLIGPPSVINFTVNNDYFTPGDVFEIIMDNSSNTITLPVAITKDGATEYKFWLPSSFYDVVESSKLVSTLHLDVPASGTKTLYRFTLTKSWTNLYTTQWTLTPNLYWSVSRYNTTHLTDLTRPSKVLNYDNLTVKNALDVQDLHIHGKVQVNGSLSHSVETATTSDTSYTLSDHDLNYVTYNVGNPFSVYLSTDPRTCIGRQHRIIMTEHSGSNHTTIYVYKQNATIGSLDHATQLTLVELTANYSNVLIMSVPLPSGGAVWMPLTLGGSVTVTEASIAGQKPA